MNILRALRTPNHSDNFRSLKFHLEKIQGVGISGLFWQKCGRDFGFRINHGGALRLRGYTQLMLTRFEHLIQGQKNLLGHAVEVEQIKRRLVLERIKCYRHFRYVHHLPAHGQQTRSNAKHVKKHAKVPPQFCKDVFQGAVSIGVKTAERLRKLKRKNARRKTKTG